MENKQSMIEEWAKKVEHSKKQELSKEAAKHFYGGMFECKEDR